MLWAQTVLHDLRADTLSQQMSRVAMSEVVKLDGREAGACEHPATVAPRYVVCVQRLSVRLAKDETVVVASRT